MGLALSCAEVSAGAVISISVGAAIINGTSGRAVISGRAIGIVVIFGGATSGFVVISCGDTGGAAIVSGPISSVSSLSMISRRYVGILVDT